MTFISPLGSPSSSDSNKPSLFEDEQLRECAKKYGKSVAQIIIKWHLQRGTVVIPKSVTLSRIEENSNVFDFAISEEDMGSIDELGRKDLRMCNPPFRAGNTAVFPSSPAVFPDESAFRPKV